MDMFLPSRGLDTVVGKSERVNLHNVVYVHVPMVGHGVECGADATTIAEACRTEGMTLLFTTVFVGHIVIVFAAWVKVRLSDNERKDTI